MTKKIIVGLRSVDGHRETRRYSTLAGASKWARSMVGNYPTFGTGYAVSDDGVCTIWVEGATLAELFPGGC